MSKIIGIKVQLQTIGVGKQITDVQKHPPDATICLAKVVLHGSGVGEQV